MNEYDFKKIEQKWSERWSKSDYGKASDDSEKPKHYHLIEFPYPSGAGLHVGHCMGYGASDAYCRMKRMQGFEVMFPIGWDAFGLPTENYAIKNKIKPQKATEDNISNFKKQMSSLALSFDWSREINTTDPEYYRWTQWIFLQFYKHAVIDNKLVKVADDTTTPRLAYQAEVPVNWCPSCKINLANEEVIAGKCERCGADTEKRKQKQWMLRITKYADRLISDLDTVDYEERIKTQQVNWIGRSEGTSIKFQISKSPTSARASAETGKLQINDKSQIQNDLGSFEINDNIKKMLDTVRQIQKSLNEQNIKVWFNGTFGVVGYYGKFFNEPADVDCGVLENDFEKANNIIKQLGFKNIENKDNGKFKVSIYENDGFNLEIGTFDHNLEGKEVEIGGVKYLVPNAKWLAECYRITAPKERRKGKNDSQRAEFLESLDSQKPNFLLLHGYTKNVDIVFFPWLKKELESKGFKVQFPDLPNSKDPKELEQIEYVLANCQIDENTIIFGHSLGAVLAMKLLLKYNKPVKGLILAAAAIDPSFPGVEPRPYWDYFSWDIDYKRIIELTGFRKVISDLRESKGAKYETKRAAYLRELAPKLDADLSEVTSRDEHFTSKTEPEILNSVIPESISNDSNEYIEVFTTRADTLYGAKYLVLSPENPMIKNFQLSISNFQEVENYIAEAKKKSDIDRADIEKEKTGVELKGVKAINPINNEEIPIFVADYVLAGYGTGAVMAVPAHDSRDFEFAKKYNLPIKEVIQKSKIKNKNDNVKLENNKAFTDYGFLINSADFDGLESKEAMKKITEKLKETGAGDFAVNYKLRDWIFSRQHYWGEPIPIIYCRKCWEVNSSKLIANNDGGRTVIDGKEYAMVPVPEDQLPVTLPEVENYEPTDTGESPLAKISDWVNVKCPVCGGEAKRETDTMPNWAGSSWYYLAYAMKINPKSEARNSKQFSNIFIEKEENLKHWMPVDLYNGGAEHITLHLLYSRFWNKFLYDLGVVPESEPYKKRIFRGIILGTDGQKMSKSRGNTISPEDMIKEFGADTLRAYIMFIGPYDQESAWNMNGIQGVHRFIKKVWENFKKVDNETKSQYSSNEARSSQPIASNNNLINIDLELQKTIKGVSEDIERFSMNTYIAKLMEFNNLLTKEKTIPKNIAEKFLILLSPAMPYVTEELWQQIGNSDSIFASEWPKYDQQIIDSDKLEIPIQINGKVRHRIYIASDITDDEMKKMALAEQVIIDHLEGKEPKKVIVVPKKLVSIVI